MSDNTRKPIRFFSGKAKDIDKSYEMFSNFSPHPVTIDSITYPTTEHYFQATKFKDTSEEHFQLIVEAETPLIAKRLGKSRKYAITDNWNQVRVEVMRTA